MRALQAPGRLSYHAFLEFDVHASRLAGTRQRYRQEVLSHVGSAAADVCVRCHRYRRHCLALLDALGACDCTPCYCPSVSMHWQIARTAPFPMEPALLQTPASKVPVCIAMAAMAACPKGSIIMGTRSCVLVIGSSAAWGLCGLCGYCSQAK